MTKSDHSKQVEFQVLRGGNLIYSRVFTSAERWQFGEYTSIALSDLHMKRPDILLWFREMRAPRSLAVFPNPSPERFGKAELIKH